jgi:hypothetical protein
VAHVSVVPSRGVNDSTTKSRPTNNNLTSSQRKRTSFSPLPSTTWLYHVIGAHLSQ